MRNVQDYGQLIEQFENGPYFRLLGFHIDWVEYGKASMRLEKKPQMIICKICCMGATKTHWNTKSLHTPHCYINTKFRNWFNQNLC